MSTNTVRRRRRWLYAAAALLVVAPLLVWMAAAPSLALLVQIELRRAGWTDASVYGVAIGLSGVFIERISLLPGDDVIIEGVRPRMGSGGVASLEIARLRLRAELAADGTLVLPGGDPAGASLPLHLMPPRGIQLGLADMHFVTPVGEVAFSMADVSVQSRLDGMELSGAYRLDHMVTWVEGVAGLELGNDDSMRIHLRVEDGRIDVDALSAGSLRGEVLAQRSMAGAPVATVTLRADVARPAGTALGALDLEAHWQGGAATFAVTSADPRMVDIKLQGQARAGDGGPSVSLAGDVWLKETAVRGRLAFDGELDGGGQAGSSGRLDLTGRDLVFPTPYGDARIDRLTARWSGAVMVTADGAQIMAGECVAWDIGSVQVAGVALKDFAPPCLAPAGTNPLLAYDAAKRRAALGVATSERPLTATLVEGEKVTTLRGIWPASQLTAALDADGLRDLTLEISGGALTLPAEQVAIRGVAGSARVSGRAELSLTAAAVESLATPALWAPLGLELDASGTSEHLAFDAVLSDRLGALVLEASGRYQDGTGTSRLKLHPVRFFPGATQPGDLSPMLMEHVQNASGEIEFYGEITWGEGPAEGAGTVRVRDFGAEIAGIELAGVETSTELGTLVPPVTLPNQHVKIERAVIGMPLERGEVVYDVDADGRVAIRRLAFDLAGGRLYSEPFIVDSAAPRDIGFVLRAEEVDLAQILAQTGMDGLEGTGTVSGRIPVRISERGLELDRGVLSAQTQGVLRYVPRELPAFLQGDDVRSSMLREVLTNFHYEELSMTVTGEADDPEAQRVTLAARGANPDFLEGHPIELNVNFEGALLGAVRSAVEVSGAAEAQELMEQRERGHEENTP